MSNRVENIASDNVIDFKSKAPKALPTRQRNYAKKLTKQLPVEMIRKRLAENAESREEASALAGEQHEAVAVLKARAERRAALGSAPAAAAADPNGVPKRPSLAERKFEFARDRFAALERERANRNQRISYNAALREAQRKRADEIRVERNKRLENERLGQERRRQGRTLAGLSTLLPKKAQQPAKNRILDLENLPIPGGLAAPLAVILIMLTLIIPVTGSGDTRMSLFFKVLLLQAGLPHSATAIGNTTSVTVIGAPPTTGQPSASSGTAVQPTPTPTPVSSGTTLSATGSSVAPPAAFAMLLPTQALQTYPTVG